MTGPNDRSYEARIGELLTTSKRGVSLLDAARGAKGMFPTEARRWFCSHGVTFSQQTNGQTAYESPMYNPELHLLDGEWYFTELTSANLAGFLGTGHFCLLGTPTVAARLDGSDSVLVDQSPFIRDRFNFFNDGVKILRSKVDVADVGSGFDKVLLDPPWYVPELLDWFALGTRAVSPGGQILLPLLGELTRPTAQQERRALLRLAARVGDVEVIPQAVEYDMPLFEQRALAASGIQLEGPWRIADLVIVSVRSPINLPMIGKFRQVDVDHWSTFVLGSQVVKLRTNRIVRDDAELIRPVEGLSDYVYDTVSQRDPRWAKIDLWTSRNRVAQVSDLRAVEAMLIELHGDSNNLCERANAIRAAHGSRVDKFLRVLEV